MGTLEYRKYQLVLWELWHVFVLSGQRKITLTSGALVFLGFYSNSRKILPLPWSNYPFSLLCCFAATLIFGSFLTLFKDVVPTAQLQSEVMAVAYFISTIATLACRQWENTSFGVVGIQAKFWTLHHPNAALEHLPACSVLYVTVTP
jgi:hypothetical protein